MVEYTIVAVKHNERRNGKKCARYWCIDSGLDDKKETDQKIYDHWFCRDIPKRILNILETSPSDPKCYGEKRGWFLLTLKELLVFRDFGHVNVFKNIISITAMEAPYRLMY